MTGEEEGMEVEADELRVGSGEPESRQPSSRWRGERGKKKKREGGRGERQMVIIIAS